MNSENKIVHLEVLTVSNGWIVKPIADNTLCQQAVFNHLPDLNAYLAAVLGPKQSEDGRYD